MIGDHRHVNTALLGGNQRSGNVWTGEDVRSNADRAGGRVNGAQYEFLRRAFGRETDLDATAPVSVCVSRKGQRLHAAPGDQCQHQCQWLEHLRNHVLQAPKYRWPF